MNPNDIGLLKLVIAWLEAEDEYMPPDERRTNAITVLKGELKDFEQAAAGGE